MTLLPIRNFFSYFKLQHLLQSSTAAQWTNNKDQTFRFHLFPLVDGREVIVPEEDGQLAVLHGGIQLTEAVICQLRSRLLQELLRDQGLADLKS